MAPQAASGLMWAVGTGTKDSGDSNCAEGGTEGEPEDQSGCERHVVSTGLSPPGMFVIQLN